MTAANSTGLHTTLGTSEIASALAISREWAEHPIQEVLAAEQLILLEPAESRRAIASTAPAASDDPIARLWNGLVLLGEDRAEDAIAEFESALSLGFDDWRVHWYLAKAAAQQKDLRRVIAECTTVLAAQPEYWFARELPKHVRGYYAQCGQDEAIEAYFAAHPTEDGVFVEVGAFDGVHYSNVRRMHEQHGWRGVSIEPVLTNYAKLARAYEGTDVVCLNLAIADEEGDAEMLVSTYPHLPDWGSDVASLSDESTERWTQAYGATWERQPVRVERLTTVLDRAGVSRVDLLSVDAEGHDLDVLRSLDLDRVRPTMIVVESGEEESAILELLTSAGYGVWRKTPQDIFFTDERPRQPGPLAAAAATKSVRHYDGSSGEQPYAEIQRDVENRLHEFLGKSEDEIGLIVICGGYLGFEIETFLKNYEHAEIHVFEPSERYHARLAERFAASPRVFCHRFAVSSHEGQAEFFEANMEGMGSLLELRSPDSDGTWLPAGGRSAESYTVQCVTLDGFAPLAGRHIDLLWCDVQGAELELLRGAEETLTRCDAVFLEVATTMRTYESQCLLPELVDFLEAHGFALNGIGLCQETGNGTGNALWLRSDAVS